MQNGVQVCKCNELAIVGRFQWERKNAVVFVTALETSTVCENDPD